jgi:multidrug efflux system membrane fusion protein
MRGTYITAVIIAALIVLWLFSGQLGKDPRPEHSTLSEQNRLQSAESQDADLTRVRARIISASPQIREVVLRGKTDNKRSLIVKSETTGRIIARPVERGTVVNTGDLLCRLSDDDRADGLEEARQALNQARIDYDGSISLRERGFVSESGIAQARARVAAARAQVTRRQLDIERTALRAPFPAIVEDIHLEVGDYVTPGMSCVSLVDMNPMLLVGRVAERDVHALTVGQTATGVLNDGRTITGTLKFVGQQSDVATRTYAIEIEVPNADLTLRSGITARIQMPVATVMAQKVSPAVFTLDDEGQIGVRTVTSANQVEYHPIQVLRDDLDGVWVTGLPDVATVITVGQELVVPGQSVQVIYEAAREMPAAAPGADRRPDADRNSPPAVKADAGAAVSANTTTVTHLAAATTR